MGFWRSVPGALVLLLILAIVASLGVVGVQGWRASHPPRVTDAEGNLAVDLAQIEDISFKASDGVDLAGWLWKGTPGRPAVVLCHDYGASKSSVVNIGILLQKRGFTVLAFDFRAHGGSRGSVSTFGDTEKRDVLGAVDTVLGLDGVDRRRLGVFGAGMGAHAAVLAAADRPLLKVLVLDGLYPDPAWFGARRVFEGWRFGVDHLAGLARLVLRIETRTDLDEGRAADVLPRLQGRDVLLVAPAGDTALAAAMQSIYEKLPLQRGAEANLVTLPATATRLLAGAELERYHDRVGAFFETRLAATAP